MPELPERIGGMPTWGVVLALGGAGIVGYFIFFRRGGGGTTATPGVVTFSGDSANPDFSASIGSMNQEVTSLGSTLNSLGGQLAVSGTGQQQTTELWNLPWSATPAGMQNGFQLAPGRWVDLGPAHAPADLQSILPGR